MENGQTEGGGYHSHGLHVIIQMLAMLRLRMLVFLFEFQKVQVYTLSQFMNNAHIILRQKFIKDPSSINISCQLWMISKLGQYNINRNNNT